jgi:hypothetical protein
MLSALALVQIESGPPARQVRLDTKVEAWSASQAALSYLIEVGARNKLPLGIVIEGNSLCTNQLVTTGRESTVTDLVSKVDMQIPGYTGEIQDGVLFIHPRVMKSATLSTLNLIIPVFATSTSSFDQVGVRLWIYIRAILVPKEGSGFTGGVRSATDSVSPFEVSNATVRTILDMIATKGQGGLWAIHEVPPDWLERPSTIPFEIYGYSDGARSLNSLSCTLPFTPFER